MYIPFNRLSCLIRAKTLKEIQSLCDGFYPRPNTQEGITEYFFDRNPENFNTILDIYRTGKLHRDKSTCALTYVEYLEYWGFHEVFLEPCCAIEYYAEKTFGDNEKESEMASLKRTKQRLKDENFGKTYIGRIRTWLWDLTEYPEKSTEARVKTNIFDLIITFYNYFDISKNIFFVLLHYIFLGLCIHFFANGSNINNRVCPGYHARISRTRRISIHECCFTNR